MRVDDDDNDNNTIGMLLVEKMLMRGRRQRRQTEKKKYFLGEKKGLSTKPCRCIKPLPRRMTCVLRDSQPSGYFCFLFFLLSFTGQSNSIDTRTG
jgi:hypothetical protein